ncbi:murein hydrolase activator EnvC family protein [Aquibacillus sediminis]|uniref:murein hydrolase activator EnvC family protein n=1 Tax=Aquibacillus sediminis TaxID=2574734 RepID=UPI0011099A2E|nr:M23 family metallopeptidase [Aquibacillus sediminis]
MKRRLSYFAILAVTLGIFFPSSVQVLANESDLNDQINDLKREKESVSNQGQDIENKQQSTEAKIAENESEQQRVLNEIEQLSQELEETQVQLTKKEDEITETNNEIEQTRQDIEELEEEIEALIERIERREELLKNRLRALQQNGGNISYLEVLMGAQSFGDFINRATAVVKIMDQDKKIMDTHKSEKEELDQKQEELETKQDNLEQKKQDLQDQKQELEQLKTQLSQQKEEGEQLKRQLEIEKEELHQYQLTLEEEEQLIRNEEAALEKAIQQAQNEKQRLEQLSKEGGSASNPPKSGGDLFGWPAGATYVSSEFNPNRMHPILNIVRPHTGMDIAASGEVPIYASAAGVVSSVFYDYPGSEIGNAIFITHYLDGQQYTTVYYHLRNGSITVSEGDTVSRGQKIGLMGSTGNSTGQHLHFEIRKGSATRGDAVDPRPYLFQ